MKELIENFRKRLIEYRFNKIGKEVSVHVNAMDIVLSLAEYALLKDRKIKKDEMKWFEAGLHLEYVFGGSEWEDLLDYFNRLEDEVISNGFVEQ